MKDFKEQLWAVRSELREELLSQHESLTTSNASEELAVELQHSKSQPKDVQPGKTVEKSHTRNPNRARNYEQLKMKEHAQRITQDEGLDWDSALAAAKERRARADAALRKPKPIYSKEKTKTKVKESKAERRKKKALRKANARKKHPNAYKWRSVQGGAPGLGKR